jgi:uncharacterized protein (TIGR03032 family)
MSTPEPARLRSVHSDGFPALLDQLGVSVVVSTYQAGKVIFLRNDGRVLNTHFRDFRQPMGLALSGNRLAVGTAGHIWEFHNVPAVARRLPPPDRHDACFLPRRSHVTGNVAIHEMAWVKGASAAELWFVNTRFSCLCTLDAGGHRKTWDHEPTFIRIQLEITCHSLVDLIPGLMEVNRARDK